MVIQVTNYVFAPGGAGVGTITFSGYVSIELKNVILITNVTDGEIIYNFRIPGNTGTVAGNVLTLMESTAAMSAGDELQIIYNDPTLTADTSTLAKESGGNLALSVTALQIIDDWDESDRAKVNPVVGQAGVAAGAGAVSANTQRVTHASDDPVTTSLQLIDDTVATDGAATPTKSVSIAGTDGTNAQTLKTDAAGELQIDVLTQPALSETTDAVSIYGSDDGGVTKRIIQTDANGQIQVDINTSSLNLETTQVDVKNSVQIMDDWDESDRAKVNLIVGQAGIAAGTGVDGVTVPRVSLATDVPLPAGTNNIGDVDVLSLPSLPAGTNNIGDVDVLTQPARAATTDSISSKDSTDVIQNGLVALTPKFKEIAASSSGDNTLLAAVSTKKIRVVAMHFVCAAAVTVRIESGAGGTALTGQEAYAANGGIVLGYNPVGWFETAASTLLNMELSAAVSVAGSFTYIEV